MDKIINHGLINQELDGADWVFSGVTGISDFVLQEDGQWEDLPVKEVQRFSWGDSMACVSYSALNCVEAIFIKRYGYEINFSDRFLAKMSGTTRSGNSMRRVGDTIRDSGLVSEKAYPSTASSWEDYYKFVPNELMKKGLEFNKKWLVQYDQVIALPQYMMDALRYSPLQVATYAYGELVGGVYQDTGKPSNHAMMVYGYKENEYWKVYDHYERAEKKFAWDTYFRLIYRFNVEKIMPEKPDIPNNKFVQCIDTEYQAQNNGEKHPDSGKIGMVLDGVILIDDTVQDRLMRTQQMRTDGIGLSADDWDKFEKKAL